MKTASKKMIQAESATRCGAGSEEKGEIAMMVARIKQSKMEVDAADARQGAQDGRNWAMRTATYQDLKALEQVAGDFGDAGKLGDEPGREVAEALAAMNNDLFGEELTPGDILEDMIPAHGQGNSETYVAAFVVAAMKVWQEVEPQVVD